MEKWTNEEEARGCIKNLVTEYYHDFHEKKKEYNKGDRISYASRVFDENEMRSLTDAMLDFWLTTGRFSNQFEKMFSELLGVKYVHIVNSGSSANLLAFAVLTSKELGERMIRKGDEVITVACGFPTTIAPIIQYGVIPVFVDIKIPEYNIDIAELEKAVTNKTKAVMLAHTLGNPFNIREVKAFCEKYNLWLIEDNCDALGSTYTIDKETKYTGTWGDIGTSSFYPPHHITMGEGGCVYTNNALLSRLILSYRDWGRDCICSSGKDNVCGKRFQGQFGELPEGYDHKYVYSHLGYNLKATDLQAAIGCAQLEKVVQFTKCRQDNWNYLKEKLKALEKEVILPKPEENSEPSWFGFLITLKNKDRKKVVSYLEENNIQTRLLFGGNIIKQPCFSELRKGVDYKVIGNLEVTNQVMNNSFWIGVYPGMTTEMLDYMIEKLYEIIKGN